MDQIFTLEENYSNVNVRKIQYVIKDDCWINISHTKDKEGYGIIKRRGKKLRLHRYVASIYLNQPSNPDDYVVMHSCNNKECINPNHLSYGTVRQNSIDAIRDNLVPLGSKKKLSKLTEESVIEIKYMLTYTHIPIKEIADNFGVNKGTIVDINQRRTWKYILPNLSLRESKTYSDEINNKIKQLLTSGNYNQKQIADICNVSTSKVSSVNVSMI